MFVSWYARAQADLDGKSFQKRVKPLQQPHLPAWVGGNAKRGDSSKVAEGLLWIALGKVLALGRFLWSADM
jgi:hypothetical protein